MCQAAHRLLITTRQNDKADSQRSWMASNLLLLYLLCLALRIEFTGKFAYKTAYLHLVFRPASYRTLSPSDWKTRESRLLTQRPCAGRDQSILHLCLSERRRERKRGKRVLVLIITFLQISLDNRFTSSLSILLRFPRHPPRVSLHP